MKKTISLILVLALGLASVSLAAEGTWTRKADMPTGRWELSTCVVDGKIYAIGGAGPVYQALRTVEEYDATTDTWTTKSEMPTARQGLSTNVVNGKIYAIGGGSCSSSTCTSFPTVEEYDPATDTWTTKSEMPSERGFHSANVVDGRIYVIGGSPVSPGGGSILTVEVYEPATDSWIQKGDMPASRGAGFSSVVDGKIYAFGGYGGSRRVDEYDPATDNWTQKSEMPTARHALSTSVVDGNIYVIGGYVPGVSGYPGVATVEVYDPATDTWTTAPDMPTGRFGPRSSVVDGKIYVIGGTAGWPAAACGTVEEYDPNPLVVDFNGDGIVDCIDMCMMVDHWLTDDTLYDIAPLPFGDGIVDVQDLILLAEHLFEEILPFGCVAYWRLDQTEGNIAHNSAGFNDGICYGEPLWQPTGGKVHGALQFDGVDDYVETDFVLNPESGSFSAFAWIKGGAPAQVIISQADDALSGRTIKPGSTWLGADPSDGKLMTGLRSPSSGSSTLPMVSDSVITDGEWHHVGIVVAAYESMRFRYLYLDGVRVASDTMSVELPFSNGGLHIGAGKSLEAGTFWSGLIDDVRIYNRAITP